MKKLESKQCLTCERHFKPDRSCKKYCSFKCYAENPKTTERLRNHVFNQVANGNKKITCLHCGVENVFRKSRAAKYCNRRCYRAYMDERFDRAILSNYEIEDFQNFDEFLLQKELKCPIVGCCWHGVNLGQHVNFTHGILARDFKKMCGFNVGTGLVTTELSETIASRPHLKTAFDDNRADVQMALEKANEARGNYTSKESQIHRKEAAILRSATQRKIKKTCQNCGCGYLNSSKKSRFCVTCEKKLWMDLKTGEANCPQCGVHFVTNYYQSLRTKRGLQVYCNIQCRQKANARKRIK